MEQVHNVEVPHILVNNCNEDSLEYTRLLSHFLEYVSHKQILTWIYNTFSDNCQEVISQNKEIEVYPVVSKYPSIKSQEADVTLPLIMKMAQEADPRSVIMKLLYFGRQPQQLFKSLRENKISIDGLDSQENQKEC